MKFTKLLLVALGSALFFVSCSDDDTIGDNKYVPLGTYDSGALVLNQGSFGNGDASVSYISYDLATLQNDIFSIVNDEDLGDTGQDIGFNGDLAYIVVNVSNKIEVVNRYTFQKVATIDSGLDNPRYIAFANGKAYVTNWGTGAVATDDYVAIIDLSTNAVTGEIAVVEGPEKIIANNGTLYVAHLGGFGFGNQVSVINSATNTVTTTVTVGDLPNALEIHGDDLWVSCSGKPDYSGAETPGRIIKLKLTDNTSDGSFAYSDATKHISNLDIEGDKVFYTVGTKVFKFSDADTTLPTVAAFDAGFISGGIYAFAVKSGRIYVGDAGGFNAAGKVNVYSAGTNSVENIPVGTLQSSYTVGVAPSGFYFNF